MVVALKTIILNVDQKLPWEFLKLSYLEIYLFVLFILVFQHSHFQQVPLGSLQSKCNKCQNTKLFKGRKDL